MTNRTDNFNRADSQISMGTPSDGGSAWVQLASAAFGIISNQGYKYANATTHEFAYLESSVADVDVQVTLSALGANAAGGLVARVTDESNHLRAQTGTGGTPLYLSKFVAGTPTAIGASPLSTTLVAGDVLKLRCNGSSITLYVNGVSVLSGTESTYSTNTKHGLHAYSNDTDSPRFEDFSITALGGGDTLMGQACL